jgi:hypothetical protein
VQFREHLSHLALLTRAVEAERQSRFARWGDRQMGRAGAYPVGERPIPFNIGLDYLGDETRMGRRKTRRLASVRILIERGPSTMLPVRCYRAQ